MPLKKSQSSGPEADTLILGLGSSLTSTHAASHSRQCVGLVLGAAPIGQWVVAAAEFAALGCTIEGEGGMMHFNTKALALTAGLIWGGALLFVGLANLVWSGYGQAFLNLMASVYPAYEGNASIGQVLLAALYGLVGRIPLKKQGCGDHT